MSVQRKSLVCWFVTLSIVSASLPALAYDWSVIGTQVVSVESTYMPDRISFKVRSAPGNCAGQWLIWNGKGATAADRQANAKATFALLLAAKVSQTTVNIFGNNAGCTIDFIHLE